MIRIKTNLFLYLKIYDWPQPTYMSKTLEELNVGTYDNMQIVCLILI